MAKSQNVPQAPVAEFLDDGQRYVVRDPRLVELGSSHLINDCMQVQIDIRGRCSARYNQPASSTYSQDLRCFYLRDDVTGKFWSVPFDPVQAEPQSFEFSAGLADIQWRVTVEDIEVLVRLVVPRNDALELWTVTVTNHSRRTRKLSLYPYFPVGLTSWLTQTAKYDHQLGGIMIEHFPYYVKVADYHKLKDRKNMIFCVGDRKPLAAETNNREFLGGSGSHAPAALRLPKLAGGDAPLENASVIMQYPLHLAPKKADTINLIFGPAQNRKDIDRLRRTYLKPKGIENALVKVHAHLQSIRPQVRIETPDTDLNHFVNHWLPHQTSYCGGLLRLNGEPCVRNAFQDAMGIVFTVPDRARYWYCTVIGHQHSDGFMPHGAALVEGVSLSAINSIPHRDMNVWAPMVLDFYMMETGDLAILDEQVGFKDSKNKATIYDHVCMGLDWQLRDRTKRKLCRIGEGDWDDPLNMAGLLNKGESIWLTEALVFALETWAKVAARMGDKKHATRYGREAKICRQTINDLAWDGKWYARGTTDAGKWFGTQKDKEGKVFLNAQSWAMISRAADTPQRINKCIEAVNKHLMTPSGPMTMAPAFTAMREDIGKITQKTPGIAENGSVYCHAAAFYAYSLYQMHQADEAFGVLRSLLTGGVSNPLERSQQLPLFIPNFYRGLACGRNAGRSSNAWNTGTAAWYYRTVVGELLGIRGEYDGLRIDPQLPKAWKQAAVWRQFRGAKYNIIIKKSSSVRRVQVALNGQILPDNLIPVQEKNTRHSVEVLVPT